MANNIVIFEIKQVNVRIMTQWIGWREVVTNGTKQKQVHKTLSRVKLHQNTHKSKVEHKMGFPLVRGS